MTAALLGRILYAAPAFLFLALLAMGALQLRKKNSARRGNVHLLIGAAWAFCLSCLAGSVFTPATRVQWDEADLYSSSLSMRFAGTALMPAQAVPGTAGPQPVGYMISKRPPAFPFLASLAHLALGPQPANLWHLNRVLLAILLFAAFCAALALTDLATALAAPLLLCSSPLLYWVCTSGAMDPLALLAVLCLAWSAGRCWQSPTRESLAWLLALGAFASYARYETGLIFALSLAPCLARAWKVKKLRVTALTGMAAALLALVPLLLLLAGPAFHFPDAKGAGPFALANIPANAPLFFQSFFVPSLGGPYSPLVSIAGLVALILSWRKMPPFFFFLLGAALLSLFLALGWFEGSPVYFVSARLYLLPSAALCLLPLLLRICVWPKQKRVGIALLAFSAVTFLLQLRPLHGGKLFPDAWAAAASQLVGNYAVEKNGKSDGKTLFVFEPPTFLVSQGAPAVSPAFFALNHEELMAMRAKGEISAIEWIVVGQETELAASAGMKKVVGEKYKTGEVASLPLLPSPVKIYSLGP